MSLAGANFYRSTPDLAAAEQYARSVSGFAEPVGRGTQRSSEPISEIAKEGQIKRRGGGSGSERGSGRLVAPLHLSNESAHIKKKALVKTVTSRVAHTTPLSSRGIS
jgi:hypothetical protein